MSGKTTTDGPDSLQDSSNFAGNYNSHADDNGHYGAAMPDLPPLIARIYRDSRSRKMLVRAKRAYAEVKKKNSTPTSQQARQLSRAHKLHIDGQRSAVALGERAFICVFLEWFTGEEDYRTAIREFFDMLSAIYARWLPQPAESIGGKSLIIVGNRRLDVPEARGPPRQKQPSRKKRRLLAETPKSAAKAAQPFLTNGKYAALAHQASVLVSEGVFASLRSVATRPKRAVSRCVWDAVHRGRPPSAVPLRLFPPEG
jgi:hypothetical protein